MWDCMISPTGGVSYLVDFSNGPPVFMVGYTVGAKAVLEFFDTKNQDSD